MSIEDGEGFETMQIETLREFVTLAKTLNYGKASELLFISQPTLTKHVKDLEAEFGVQLFNRNTKSVSITDAGLYLYAQAIKIVDIYDTTYRHFAVQETDALCIAVPLRYQTYGSLIERALIEMEKRHPEINCRIVDSGLAGEPSALLNEGCDVWISYAMPEFAVGRLAYKELFKLRAAIWLSKSNELSAKDRISVQELNNLVFRPVSNDKNNSWTRLIMGFLARHGVTPVIGEMVDDQFHLGEEDFTVVTGGKPYLTFGFGVCHIPLIEEVIVTAAAIYDKDKKTDALTHFLEVLTDCAPCSNG